LGTPTFFLKYSVIGEKAQDFSDFCEIVSLVDQGLHLTDEGLDQIHQIRSARLFFFFNKKKAFLTKNSSSARRSSPEEGADLE
jgi:hypothetical protein